MEFRCSSLGRLFSGSSPLTLRLGAQGVTFIQKDKRLGSCAYEDIYKVSATPRMLRWSDVSISSATHTYRSIRLTKDQAKLLRRELTNRIQQEVARQFTIAEPSIEQLSHAATNYLSSKAYLANRDHQTWLEQFVHAPDPVVERAIRLLRHPMLSINALAPRQQGDVARLVDLTSSNPQILKDHNHRFVEDELVRYAQFFDRLDKFPLTEEQRRAAVIMEDRNLLIAPAGSGKTSALVGKIGYALKTAFCKPEEIAVVAYNATARREVQKRLTDQLSDHGDLSKLHVHTFHSLGKAIIANANQRQPNLSKVAEDDQARTRLFDELVNELNESDPTFRSNYFLYHLFYSRPVASTFASNRDAINTPSSFSDTAHVNQTGELRTLAKEKVKSRGEQTIANWFYINQIRYEYEPNYEHDTATETHRQYRPDFYLPDINCYLEHYALDKHGQPPAEFGREYLDSMVWKRALHKEMGTECLETTFHEFVTGSLFEKLERELTGRGLQLNPLSDEERQAKLLELDIDPRDISRLLSVAARHAKSNMLSREDIKAAADTHDFRARARFFAALLNTVNEAYEKSLRQEDEIDFEDMINFAIKSAENSRLAGQFKLILVDEFQDISAARASLISELLKQSTDCKLFAVGDDWQSIYRFSGADNSLFRNFGSKFGVTATSHLTRTFRFNQGISDIAAQFVSKNPAQITKSVQSTDLRKEAVAVCFRAETEDDEKRAFYDVLQTLSSSLERTAVTANVFVLARYNFVLTKARDWLSERSFPGISVEFSTVHRAKGLEAEYVILLDANSGKFGFPAELEDDPLLQLVMPDPETFAHAEERRLFYVALTRAKNVFYCISNDRSPSVFLCELAEDWGHTRSLKFLNRTSTPPTSDCPKCHVGVLRKLKGQYGSFMGCSRYPRCTYTTSNDPNGKHAEGFGI